MALPALQNSIAFVPSSGFTGGVGNISVTATVSEYKTVDLYDDEKLSLNYQIQTDMSNKAATYSKTIKVPGTSNNNILFNNLFNISNYVNQFNFSGSTVIFLNKKIDSGIYMDSIEILLGYFELNRVLLNGSLIEYEGTFYSRVKSLADAIGDKIIRGNEETLDDISFSEYNHLFNFTNINYTQLVYYGPRAVNFANYAGSKGVYYPVIDYANITDGNEYRLENFRPCIYAKELWDKIWNKAGFTYTSNFLSGSEFKSIVIPQGNELTEWNLNSDNYSFRIGVSGNTNLIENIGYGGAYKWIQVPYNQASGTTLTNKSNSWNTSTNQWLIKSSGAFNITANVNFGVKMKATQLASWSLDVSGPAQVYTKLRIQRKRNNVVYTVYESPITQIGISKTDNGALDCRYTETTLLSGQTISAASEEMDCLLNDIIYIELGFLPDIYIGDCSYGSSLYKGQSTIFVEKTDESLGLFTIVANEPIKKNYYYENSMVYPNDCLPSKMRQLDYIKSISNRFNLMMIEDKTNPYNFIVEPYDDFYSGTTYVDWSDKIDISKEFLIDRYPFLIDRDLNFKMKDDGDDYLLSQYKNSINKNFGDRYITNPYYTSGSETVEDQFSSAQLGKLGDTNWTVSKIYGQEDEYYGMPTSSNYNYKLLYRNTITGRTATQLRITAMNYAVDGSSGTTGRPVAVMDTQPYAGFLDNPYTPTKDINYGPCKFYNHISPVTSNNVGWRFWKKKTARYMNVNSKQLTCYAFLNHSDLANLDWRKKIFINNQLYKLSKIFDWTPFGSSKVELLQEASLDEGAFMNQDINTLSSPIETRTKKTVAVKRTVINLQKPPISMLIPVSGTSNDVATLSAYTYSENKNIYPQNSVGIVIGSGNVITESNFMVQGDFNTVNNKSATILNSNYNTVDSDDVFLMNSHSNTIKSGVTNVMMIGTTGITIDTNNKVYIKNVDSDTLVDYTYVDSKSGATILEANTYTDLKSGATILNSYTYTDTKSGQTLTNSYTYTDTKSGQTLTDAKAYTNTKSGQTLTNSYTYTDTKSGQTLTDSKIYTDTKSGQTLTNSYTYTDTKSGQTLTDSKIYTDTKSGQTLQSSYDYTDLKSGATILNSYTYTDTKSGQTLTDAKTYTDVKVSGITVSGATQEWVNIQISTNSAITLTDSYTYTDLKSGATILNSYTYTDTKSGQTLTDSKIYTDTKSGQTLTNSYTYTDTKSGQTLQSSYDYTDLKSGQTLQAAENYTDTKVSGITSGATESWVTANFFNSSSHIVMDSAKNIVIPANAALYIGNKDTAGCWKLSVDVNGNLLTAVYSGSTYVTKQDVPKE